jgi:hypothetical protein
MPVVRAFARGLAWLGRQTTFEVPMTKKKPNIWIVSLCEAPIDYTEIVGAYSTAEAAEAACANHHYSVLGVCIDDEDRPDEDEVYWPIPKPKEHRENRRNTHPS